MNTFWKAVIWHQFGAAIEMLENAIRACPQEFWTDRSHQPEFWYTAYHTLFFLDYYLSDSAEAFIPPTPFTLDELDPAGLLPEYPFAKDELQGYLEHCRQKCRRTIEALTEEKARERCGFERPEICRAELLLYNLRHVQHHSGQLNLILRQRTDSAPGWVAWTN